MTSIRTGEQPTAFISRNLEEARANYIEALTAFEVDQDNKEVRTQLVTATYALHRWRLILVESHVIDAVVDVLRTPASPLVSNDSFIAQQKLRQISDLVSDVVEETYQRQREQLPDDWRPDSSYTRDPAPAVTWVSALHRKMDSLWSYTARFR